MLEKYIARNSNIELLRLIIIYMIVLYHLIMHSYGEMTSRNVIWDISTSICHIGVVCFILISGYYGINATIKGFSKLVSMCFFYSILLYFVFIIYTKESFSLSSFFASLTPILHEEWWFMTSYIVLYVLSPYLNSILKSPQKTQNTLLLVLGMLMFYLGWIGHISTIHAGRDIISFAFIYMLGYKLRNNQFKHWSKVYVISCCIIIFGQLLGLTIPYISKLIRFASFGYNSPGMIIMATSFFMMFISITETHFKWINYASTSVLPVYLIHENHYTKPYMEKILEIDGNPYILLILIMTVAFCIVIICITIDKLLGSLHNKIALLAEYLTNIFCRIIKFNMR